MEINLLLFAAARTLADEREEVRLKVPLGEKLNGRHIAELIYEQYPCLLPLKGKCMLTLDLNYIENLDSPLELSPESELAFIPPVSGG